MELHCRIHHGLTPGLLDRLVGVQAHESIWTADLCLTKPDSRHLVPTRDLVRVFGSIVHRLAEVRSIWVLFPYDVGQVKRKLGALNIESRKERGTLAVEIASPHLPLLTQVLEAGASTTFYSLVEKEAGSPPPWTPPLTDLKLLFKDFGQAYFLGVFSLYDESMELLSKFLPAEFIINAVREVGTEEGVQVFC